MKKLIEAILEEEKMARNRVEEAKEKAKQIRLEAENTSQKILEETRQKGMEESKTIIAEAEEEAKRQKEAELMEASRSGESLWTDKKKTIDETVELLYRMVLGEDVEKS